MYLEEGLYAYITADATVTGLISSRLYPTFAPQEVITPYVTYMRASTEHSYDLAGPNHLTRCRVSFSCFADTALAARGVADAIIDRIDGHMGAMGTVTIQAVMRINDFASYEPLTVTPTVIVDFDVMFLED